MKARIKFRKYGALRFIGHLDVMRYFQKVMRRAEIPIAFTGGYSPHMIMSFASPLGIGLTSDGEYFDIELKEAINSKEAVRRMNEVSAEGIDIISFRQISDEKKMTGMAIISAADYLVRAKDRTFPSDFQEKVSAFLAQPAIVVLKQTKRSEKEVDIRPMIYRMEMQEGGIFMHLAAGSAENLKPNLVMQAFLDFAHEDPTAFPCTYHRLELYADGSLAEREGFVSLEDLGWEIE